MSEYQYYEFQTADRRLSEKEMGELRAYSTRAVITPTSFSNEYNFGDFKGNPIKWVEKYFDGFVYLANWGTHELQLALPGKLLAAQTAGLYLGADLFREKNGKAILTFRSDEDPGDEWVEGVGILSSLLPLRSDLARGDLRALYIGWLSSVQNGELDEEATEPPVPPNLQDLSGPLQHLMDFLRIDCDLFAVASAASPRQAAVPFKRKDVAAWVSRLAPPDKDAILVRLITGDDPTIREELLSRFKHSRNQGDAEPATPLRTVGQLLAAAEDLRSKRNREESRRVTERKAQRSKSNL